MPSLKYKHLFFDLDRTLWDFDKNSIETFKEIHNKYDLSGKGVSNFDKFMDIYHKINTDLWEMYRKGGIEKEVLSVERFSLTLSVKLQCNWFFVKFGERRYPIKKFIFALIQSI